MAIASTAVWELRSAGSNTNGGFYIPGASGVDYSQQNAAQYALTNGVTNGTTTIATTSAAADMVGNGVYVAGGTGSVTGVWKQITAASAGVSITVDSSAGLTAGTGVTLNVGGALGSFGTLQGLTQPSGISPVMPGNTVYCKGSFTLTSVVQLQTNANDPTAGGSIKYYGYTTTRGDNGTVTVTTATNSTILFQFESTCRQAVFYNFSFTTTAGTKAAGCLAHGQPWGVGFDNCTWDGFTYGIYGDFNNGWAFQGLYVNNSEIKNCTSDGIYQASAVYVSNSWLHNNTNNGFTDPAGGDSSRGPQVLFRSTFSSNGGRGVQIQNLGNAYNSTGGQAFVVQCNFYGNTSDGFASTFSTNNGVTSTFFSNNISYGNGGYGAKWTQAYGVILGASNAYGGNTSGARDSFFPALSGDVTLTVDPFTNAAGGDFSLNSTAGGGTACKNAGFPGVSKFGTGYASIGALDPNTGGGGGTTIVVGRSVTQYLGSEGEM